MTHHSHFNRTTVSTTLSRLFPYLKFTSFANAASSPDITGTQLVSARDPVRMERQGRELGALTCDPEYAAAFGLASG